MGVGACIRIGTHQCLLAMQEMQYHMYNIALSPKFRIKIVVVEILAFPCIVSGMILRIFLLIFFATKNVLNSDLMSTSYSAPFVIAGNLDVQ